jgi:hypothetical protein
VTVAPAGSERASFPAAVVLTSPRVVIVQAYCVLARQAAEDNMVVEAAAWYIDCGSIACIKERCYLCNVLILAQQAIHRPEHN